MYWVASLRFCCSTNLPITVRTSIDFLESSHDECYIPVDLNALAWLEDYLQTWPGTLLVVYVYMFLFFFLFRTVDLSFSSHDRAFL
jgi:hypothetical protein